MSLGVAAWKGRRKRIARRIGHDVRAALPLSAILFCLSATTMTILAAERIEWQRVFAAARSVQAESLRADPPIVSAAGAQPVAPIRKRESGWSVGAKGREPAVSVPPTSRFQ